MEPITCIRPSAAEILVNRDSITRAILYLFCLWRFFLFSCKNVFDHILPSQRLPIQSLDYIGLLYIYILENKSKSVLMIVFKSHRTDSEDGQRHFNTHKLHSGKHVVVLVLPIPSLAGYSRLCSFQSRPLARRSLIWDMVNVKAHFTCEWYIMLRVATVAELTSTWVILLPVCSEHNGSLSGGGAGAVEPNRRWRCGSAIWRAEI